MLSDATLAYGEDMVRVLLGVDRLVRQDGGENDDGLVVLNMAPDHTPELFSGFPEADARLEELTGRAGALPERDRQVYYRQLCESTRALLRWRQGQLAFGQQIGRFLHVPAEPARDTELEGLQRQMRAALTELGYDGDLAEQCAAWEDRHRVPADEVIPTLDDLMSEAWDRTAEAIDIPADRSDGMHALGVSGVPFNAKCDYLNRTVELNTDVTLTLPGLRHLTVHECYPGHYVQFKLRETLYARGEAAADGLLSIVNSASSSPFEGIADNGMRVIGWLDTPDDALLSLLGRYRAGIGTVAAWHLHADGWPEDRVADWLRERALVGGEGWVANRMAFIAAPQRAALIWSYWWGDRAVGAVWEQQTPEVRPELLRYLYDRMHSVATVEMFAPGTVGDTGASA